MTQSSSTGRFDRGARLHLALMAILLVYALGMTAYRFMLPTDGWLSGEIDDISDYGFVYDENLVGIPSELQPGDHLVAVNGVSLARNNVMSQWSLADEWRAGNTVRYTVQRGGQEVEFDVALTKWSPASFMRAGGQSVTTLIGYLGIAVFLGISLLALWRRPENPTARALWVLAAVTAALFAGASVLPAMVPDYIDPLTNLLTIVFITSAFTILWPPAMIRFALLFPHPKPILARRPWIARLPYAIGAIGIPFFLAQFYIFGWVWMAVSVFASLAILVHNAMTMRDAASRAQLRWGLGGVIVGLGLFFLTFIPVFIPVPEWLEAILIAPSALGFGVMGIGLGIAVMRYRLFDIDVIIRRTTSYALLTALLALVYFGSVVVLQRLLSPITGESTAAVVLSTLLIAALFLPLRRWVQGIIDRRFFRQKYDAEQVLARFAATARDETDLDALTAELARVIQETMQPESVSVWLRPVERERRQTTD